MFVIDFRFARTGRLQKLACIAALVWISPHSGQAQDQLVERPVHTYSIVARDPKTGTVGVAIHSHWFHVGQLSAWAEPGVGAIATQALTNPRLGHDGLTLLKSGKSPKATLKSLLASDTERERRQVGIIDVQGRTATHTGTKCVRAAGHASGKNWSAQANLMESSKVWTAMGRAFETTRGPLAERMLAALEAAEQAGGDLRGKQSAAIKIVSTSASDTPWNDTFVDLEVEDHKEPLRELRRLLNVQRAYEAWGRADGATADAEPDAARKHMAEVKARLPKRRELPFWHALTLYNAGHRERATALFVDLLRAEHRWCRVLERLPKADLLSQSAVDAILAAAKPGPSAVEPEPR